MSPVNPVVSLPVGIRRVVIADDSHVVRGMLEMAIRLEPALEVVARAEDGAQAVEAWHAHRPDALIIDCHMPVMTGVESIRAIRATDPATGRLIMFSSDPTAEVDALAAGADAFFLKGQVGPVDLVDYLLGAPDECGPGTVGHAVAAALGKNAARPA